MLNSLLNASNLSIDSLILDIFIILGVVIAGALIVYFLWEAVASIVNKTKKSGHVVAEPVFDAEDKKKVKKNSAAKEEVFVSDFKLDAEPMKEETAPLMDETKIVPVDEVLAEEEKIESQNEISEQERENAERRAYLEARRQELIKRMQAEMEESNDENIEAEKTETEEENVSAEEVSFEPETEEVEGQEANNEVEDEEISNEENDLQDEQENEEDFEVETPVEEEIVEETEEVENLEEERKALALEKEKYETMVKELEEAKKALAEQSKEIAPAPTVEVSGSKLSLEELKGRLEVAEDRLKATEKEFKQCKKEYLPLRRVWDAHEKDANKLRRKEALVAKQKVLLYGVNNYADIDEEKAKKLAEDLDLLDGLKLSVQHCEEVMKKNEERFPLLEKMYNVLSIRNEELKNDIATYRAEIERLEKQNADDAETNE